jgi:hypothetical protein
MYLGRLFGLIPALNSVTAPGGVMRPMRPPKISANHRLPSEPVAMPNGLASGLIPSPSGPAAMPSGPLLGVIPSPNSVTTPSGVMRPMRSTAGYVNHRLPSRPTEGRLRA